LVTKDLRDGLIPFPYLAIPYAYLAPPSGLTEQTKFTELTQLLALLARISGQFATNETKKPVKTKTLKAAFCYQLSASSSIRYDEDAA
jgi:hypothetical protein